VRDADDDRKLRNIGRAGCPNQKSYSRENSTSQGVGRIMDATMGVSRSTKVNRVQQGRRIQSSGQGRKVYKFFKPFY
jgi:hypothetical protein